VQLQICSLFCTFLSTPPSTNIVQYVAVQLYFHTASWRQSVGMCFCLVHLINDYTGVLVRIWSGFWAVMMIDFPLCHAQFEKKNCSWSEYYMLKQLAIRQKDGPQLHTVYTHTRNKITHSTTFKCSCFVFFKSGSAGALAPILFRSLFIFTRVSHLLNLSSCNKETIARRLILMICYYRKSHADYWAWNVIITNYHLHAEQFL